MRQTAIICGHAGNATPSSDRHPVNVRYEPPATYRFLNSSRIEDRYGEVATSCTERLHYESRWVAGGVSDRFNACTGQQQYDTSVKTSHIQSKGGIERKEGYNILQIGCRYSAGTVFISLHKAVSPYGENNTIVCDAWPVRRQAYCTVTLPSFAATNLYAMTIMTITYVR